MNRICIAFLLLLLPVLASADTWPRREDVWVADDMTAGLWPTLWLDASYPKSITYATGASAWASRVGAYSFTQSTGANQALPSTAATGRTCLVFDGGNDVMASTATIANVFGASAKTVFVVGQITTPTASANLLVDSVSKVYIAAVCNAINGCQADNYVAAWGSIRLPYPASPKVMAFWHDGVNLYGATGAGQETSVSSGATSTTTGTLVLGQGWAGPICEVILFNRVLGHPTIYRMIAALQRKWNISSFTIPRPAYHTGLNSNAANTSVGAIIGANAPASANTSTFTTASGKISRALDFNGTTHKVTLTTDVIGATAATLTAWVYVDGGHEDGSGRILDNGKTIFTLADAGTLSLMSDGSTAATSAAGAVASGAWVHVAAVRNAAGLASIYVNGELSGTANQSSGTPAGGSTNVIIGANNAGAQSFNGKLDDIRVYTVELTPAQIRWIYNGGVGREE